MKTQSFRPTLFFGLGVLFALALFLYTGLTGIFAVPPVHYDEAWFGTLAWRIAKEPSFWPLSGMNSYTAPILQYLLAGAFQVFGTQIETTRLFFFCLNGITLLLFSTWIFRRNPKAALIFTLFYSVLPVSVFNQRIQLEVTSWFAFCYALILWGLAFWDKRPKASFILLGLGLILGISSHILFFIVYLSLYWWLFWYRRDALFSPRGRMTASVLLGMASIFPIRMALGISSGFAGALGMAFVGLSVLTLLGPKLDVGVPGRVLKPGGRAHQSLRVVLFLASVAPCLLYFILDFGGTWPYAQITGEAKFFYLPLNLILFFAICLLGWKPSRLSKTGVLEYCLLIITLSGFAVLKPTSAKYWMIPTITVLFVLSEISAIALKVSPKRAASLICGVILWNLFLFQNAYIHRSMNQGADQGVFHIWRFADSAIYYRAVTPIYFRLKELGCQMNSISVDRGRMNDVKDYFQLLDKTGSKGTFKKLPCKFGDREFYMGTPQDAPQGFELLEKRPSWGDMELWIQSFNTKTTGQ